MSNSASRKRMTSADITKMMRRICEHLGIAFSANRVFPSLADLTQDGRTVSEVEELNACGKHFGIRFRQMTGSIRDLVHCVSDSGPVLVRPKSAPGDIEDRSFLILGVKSRNRLLVHHNGRDQIETVRWLRRNLELDEELNYQWLLIQPMLAVENASRFHYQGGTQSEPIQPLERFV